MKDQIQTALAPKQVTLYGLSSDIVALEELLEKAVAGEEISAMALQNEIICMLQSKVDNVCSFDDYMEDTIALVKKKEKELKALRDVLENKRESFNKYVKFCMEKASVTEMRGELRKVTIPRARKVVEILNHSEIPEEYIKVEKTYTPIKGQILEALKAGVHVPGTKLIDSESRVQFKNITI